MTRNQAADLTVRATDWIANRPWAGALIPAAGGFSTVLGISMFLNFHSWGWLLLFAAGVVFLLICPVGATVGLGIKTRRVRVQLQEAVKIYRRQMDQDDPAGPADLSAHHDGQESCCQNETGQEDWPGHLR